jgi:hypothetical protein
MIERVYHACLFALYQLSIALGILAMPAALAVQQTAGRAPPVHRVVDRVGTAYENAQR